MKVKANISHTSVDLRLVCYVPFDMVGLLIGKQGSNIIQLQNSTQTSISHPKDKEKRSEWSHITIEGQCENLLKAYHQIEQTVDSQVDAVVLEFPADRFLSLDSQHIEALKTISADTDVRIYIPNLFCNPLSQTSVEYSHNDRYGALEGQCDDVFRAFKLIEASLRQNSEEMALPVKLCDRLFLAKNLKTGVLAFQAHIIAYIEQEMKTRISKVSHDEESDEETSIIIIEGEQKSIVQTKAYIQRMIDGENIKDVIDAIANINKPNDSAKQQDDEKLKKSKRGKKPQS